MTKLEYDTVNRFVWQVCMNCSILAGTLKVWYYDKGKVQGLTLSASASTAQPGFSFFFNAVTDASYKPCSKYFNIISDVY
jgi:hypothetical protein